MKKAITRKEFMKMVMRHAHFNWSMRDRFSWLKDATWGDCVREAWESISCFRKIEKRETVKAVRTVKVTPVVYPKSITEAISREYDRGISGRTYYGD